MNFIFSVALAILLSICIAIHGAPGYKINENSTETTEEKLFKYPEARRNESVVDILHGKEVSDPYRWLEDPDSVETKQFIEDQINFSRPFLRDDPAWLKINEQLTSLWKIPCNKMPKRAGKYYLFKVRSSGLKQSDLYKRVSLDAEKILLLDVNALSSDSEISLQSWNISPDENLLAYHLSKSGSDWIEIRIVDIETGNQYPDSVKHVKFSEATWTHDNNGFFYCRFDPKSNADGTNTEVNEYQKLYYHRIGEAQENDTLILEYPQNPMWRIFSEITHDGKYLLVRVKETLRRSMYYIDLYAHGKITEKLPLIKMDTLGVAYDYVTNIGSKMIFLASQKILMIDIHNSTNFNNWGTLIEESPNHFMYDARCIDNDKIVISYLHDVKSEMRVYSLHTGNIIRDLPCGIGTIKDILGSKNSSELFYTLDSFLTPEITYKYDFSTPDIDPAPYCEIKSDSNGIDWKNFTIEQVFYPSDDGTKIPMFIVQKNTDQKRLKPTLLYAYGGFGASITPKFDGLYLQFVNNFDGILAIANVRGGGEYGKKWYDGGRLLNKQNSYTDFQAAAKYLIENNYTESKKIAIYGQSNGGLMIGACINQRPDLFGAAVAQAGVMDLYRFHKFTVGKCWSCDYGNPENKKEFENISKFSPLHNVCTLNCTAYQYPSTLILTADHDDRVSPLHSLKFTATLQHKLKNYSIQTNPILLKIYENEGHFGESMAKLTEKQTDIATFLYRRLHIDEYIDV